MKNRSSL